jgi:hypothetical protein
MSIPGSGLDWKSEVLIFLCWHLPTTTAGEEILNSPLFL